MNKQRIGWILQLAGAVVIVAGLVLSLHHVPIAVCFLGGGAAFYVGKKLRSPEWQG